MSSSSSSSSSNSRSMRMSIAWQDLSVKVTCFGVGDHARTPNKTLLHALTGFARPGHVMALMGPSGSGKTTFLDALTGRLAANVTVTGNILINGKNRKFYPREMSYVAQEECFFGTLTVRETLTHSAMMRLISKMSKEEIREVVENTMIEMGLEECADNQIGNWHLRGISSGEKKRLSIGLEILTRPHVLFLDEPTAGLDSASAFFVMQALSHIARGDKIVICSIHQPSSEIFDLLDDLLLLSGGETVYFGEAKMALEVNSLSKYRDVNKTSWKLESLIESSKQFFTNAGFPCPTRRNPSDHFLLCINLDFDLISTLSNGAMAMKTAEIRATLVERYKTSELMLNAKRMIEKLKSDEEQVLESNIRRSTSSWWKQLCTLTQRSFLNMTRDTGYYWLRIIFHILVSISIGTLFYQVGADSKSILARTKCVSFIYGFMICLTTGGLPFFIEDLKVFYGERSKGHYGEAVYVLSNILSSLPFIVLLSLFPGIIIYYMVRLHQGLSHFVFLCINLFCCFSVAESFLMVVATVIPNVLISIGTGIGVTVFMIMSSEIFRPVPDIPKIFWRYPMSYLSFATWAIQGHYKNDMLGLEFEYPLLPGGSRVKGERILKLVFGFSNYNKWWDISALIALLLLNRVLLYIVLRYNNKPKSPSPWFYAKLSLHRFAQRFLPSLKSSISSNKQHASRPLSSEEGLMSPNFAI